VGIFRPYWLGDPPAWLAVLVTSIVFFACTPMVHLGADFRPVRLLGYMYERTAICGYRC